MKTVAFGSFVYSGEGETFRVKGGFNVDREITKEMFDLAAKLRGMVDNDPRVSTYRNGADTLIVNSIEMGKAHDWEAIPSAAVIAEIDGMTGKITLKKELA